MVVACQRGIAIFPARLVPRKALIISPAAMSVCPAAHMRMPGGRTLNRVWMSRAIASVTLTRPTKMTVVLTSMATSWSVPRGAGTPIEPARAT